MNRDARSLFASLLRQRMTQGENSILLHHLSPADALRVLTPLATSEPRVAPSAEPERPARSPGAPAPRTLDSSPGPTRQHAEVSTEAIEAATSLPVLAEMASGCPRCSLAEGRTTVVFGEGSVTADVMVVGEAPGAEEDRTGRPFVGRSGKLLDRLLLSVGYARPQVYICNVLKCRPPGNRNPSADEIEICSPYLLRQVELLRPRAILACGTFAAQTLLATRESIGKLRGHVHEYHGVPLVPTYHPAAVLRNPAWGRLVWEDLQLLRGIADPLPGSPESALGFEGREG